MKIKTKYIVLVVFIAVLVAVDLIAKHFCGDIEYTNIIPKLINFETNHGNEGAAWGLFSGKKVMLIIVGFLGIIVFVLLDLFVIKQKNKLYVAGLSLYLAGTVGNLIDRLSLGYVRDFINFSFWPSFPTFNFADCFLCIGAVLLCIDLLLFYNKDKNGKK